jgi:hypothetical protein
MELFAISARGQIRPWCSISVEGSLSPDSFRAGRMRVTAELGQKLPFPFWTLQS